MSDNGQYPCLEVPKLALEVAAAAATGHRPWWNTNHGTMESSVSQDSEPLAKRHCSSHTNNSLQHDAPTAAWNPHFHSDTCSGDSRPLVAAHQYCPPLNDGSVGDWNHGSFQFQQQMQHQQQQQQMQQHQTALAWHALQLVQLQQQFLLWQSNGPSIGVNNAATATPHSLSNSLVTLPTSNYDHHSRALVATVDTLPRHNKRNKTRKSSAPMSNGMPRCATTHCSFAASILPPHSIHRTLSHARDALVLTPHQVWVRKQISIVTATVDHVSTHTRGRNQRLVLHQVGVQCRHCAHMAILQRPRGALYFPATLLGLYQAAQNMSSNHLQCGQCPGMPPAIHDEFLALLPTKTHSSSAAGKEYWATCAKEMGLVDTDHGIAWHAPAPTPPC
jgi:hypothetical protein